MCVCVFLSFFLCHSKLFLSLSPMHMNNNLLLFLFACKTKQNKNSPPNSKMMPSRKTPNNTNKNSHSQKDLKPFLPHTWNQFIYESKQKFHQIPSHCFLLLLFIFFFFFPLLPPSSSSSSSTPFFFFFFFFKARSKNNFQPFVTITPIS